MTTHHVSDEVIENARLIATEAHEGQVRSGAEAEPYIEHPRRVSESVDKDFGPRTTNVDIAAAWLHDVLEDCDREKYAPRIYRECGQAVLGLVDLLTKPDARPYRTKIYQARMLWVPVGVLCIKVADRVDNLRSLGGADWPDKRRISYLQSSLLLADVVSARSVSLARPLRAEIHDTATQYGYEL